MNRLLTILLCGLVATAQAAESLEVFAHSLDGAAELQDGKLRPIPVAACGHSAWH